MKTKQISIIIKLFMEGIHNFPDVEKYFPSVSFLKHPHRHTFHIECEYKVNHLNRDKEFILEKRKIAHYLNEKYLDKHIGCLNFNSMSCEQIAADLFDYFELKSCTVSEDNEFFAKLSD